MNKHLETVFNKTIDSIKYKLWQDGYLKGEMQPHSSTSFHFINQGHQRMIYLKKEK